MTQVAGQAVGQVDRGMRDAAQRLPEREPRLRPVQSTRARRLRRPPRFGPLRPSGRRLPARGDRERGAAERPRDPDFVARPARGRGAAPAPGGTCPNTVMDIASGPRVVSPPTSGQAMPVGEREHAAAERLEPRLVDGRQRDRQGEAERLRRPSPPGPTGSPPATCARSPPGRCRRRNGAPRPACRTKSPAPVRPPAAAARRSRRRCRESTSPCRAAARPRWKKRRISSNSPMARRDAAGWVSAPPAALPPAGSCRRACRARR